MHQYQAFIKYSRNGQSLRQVAEFTSSLPTAEAALVEFMCNSLNDHLNGSIEKALKKHDIRSAQRAVNLLNTMRSPLSISVLFRDIFSITDVTLRRNEPQHTTQDIFDDYLTLRIFDEAQGVVAAQKKRAPQRS